MEDRLPPVARQTSRSLSPPSSRSRSRARARETLSPTDALALSSAPTALGMFGSGSAAGSTSTKGKRFGRSRSRERSREPAQLLSPFAGLDVDRGPNDLRSPRGPVDLRSPRGPLDMRSPRGKFRSKSESYDEIPIAGEEFPSLHSSSSSLSKGGGSGTRSRSGSGSGSGGGTRSRSGSGSGPISTSISASRKIGAKLFSRKRSTDSDSRPATLDRSKFLSPTAESRRRPPDTEPTARRRPRTMPRISLNRPPPLTAYRAQQHLDTAPSPNTSTKDLLAERERDPLERTDTMSSEPMALRNATHTHTSSSLKDSDRSTSWSSSRRGHPDRDHAHTMPSPPRPKPKRTSFAGDADAGEAAGKKKTLAEAFLPVESADSASSISSIYADDEAKESAAASESKRSLLVDKSERGLFGLRNRRAPSDADFDPSDADAAYSSLVASTATIATTSSSRSRRSSEASSASASNEASRLSNNGLNTVEFPDDSRQNFFVEQFGLAPEERLLGHFACALRKKVLLQGRIYVSRRWVCFYSNVFSYKTVLKIPVSEISKVSPKASFFLETSIRIYTTTYIPTNAAAHAKSFRHRSGHGSTHLFTSFFSRDDALRLMRGVVESHKDSRQSESKPASVAGDSSAASSSESDTDRESDDEESDEDSTDAEQGDGGSEEQRAMQREKRARMRRQQSLVDLKKTLADEALPDAIDDAEFAAEVANVSMSQIANEVLPVSSRELFDLCWSDNAEISFEHFFKKEGESSVSVTEWSGHTKFGTTRNLTFVTEIKDVPSFAKSMLSSTSTPVNRLERIRRAKTCFAALDQVNSPDVPWGNCFHMLVRWKAEDESPTSCRVTLDFGIVFVEKVRFFGGKIESRSKQDFTSAYARYFAWVRSELEAKSDLLAIKRRGLPLPKRASKSASSGSKTKKNKTLKSKSAQIRGPSPAVDAAAAPSSSSSKPAASVVVPSASSSHSSPLSDLLSSPLLAKASLVCAAVVFFILLVVISLRLSSVSYDIGALNSHINELEGHIRALHGEVHSLRDRLALDEAHGDVNVNVNLEGVGDIS